MRSLISTTILLSAVGSSLAATTTTIDFSDLSLSPDSYFNGGPTNSIAPWTSGGATFSNTFTDFGGGFTGWTGWAYSNVNNATDGTFTNQYAAYTGSGVGGSGVYAVAFGDGYVDLPAGQAPVSAAITNTTYGAIVVRDGNGFARPFGDDPATGAVETDYPDYFEVTFTGYTGAGASGTPTGTVTFRLADYTFADDADDYIVDSWETLDLSPLGSAVSIGFGFVSTDIGSFGINNPTYFALDNLVTVPEPVSAASVVLLAGLLSRRRRRS